MADVIVSRIQHRRGNLIDLPQPLLVGELGLAIDTKQVFIGADPANIPEGAQVYPGFYALAQNYLDTRILRFSVADLAEMNTLQTNLSNLLDPVLASDTRIAEISVGVFEGYVMLTAAQAATPASLTDIINEIISVTGGAPVYPGASITISLTNGSFSSGFHARSNTLANILNSLSFMDSGISADPIATTKLNIEILTEYSEVVGSGGGDAPVLVEVDLSPQVVFTNVPGFSILIAENDTAHIDYSIFKAGAPAISAAGELKMTGSIDLTSAFVTDDRSEIKTPGAEVVEFKAIYSAGSMILQYRNTYAASVKLKTSSLLWNSFS